MAAVVLRRFRIAFQTNKILVKSNCFFNISSSNHSGVFSKRMATNKFSVCKTNALEKLRAFGYAFNPAGQLRQLDGQGNITEKPFVFEKTLDYNTNQAHYEALGKAIPDIVYELLEKAGMTRSYFPEDTPQEEQAFVFTQPAKLNKSKKLLILIHGSGAVRAGQWARSLIINHSIDHGTMMPYIKCAIELEYDILIMNTNDNVRNINGVVKTVVDGHTPMKHAISAWKRYVMDTEAQSIAIVAHSFGGIITMELANHFPEFFKERVFAVALTDSVHNDTVLNENMLQFMSTIACNWRASKEKLDTVIESSYDALKQVSAGHEKHEWTSYAAMSSVFKFLEDRYQDFEHRQNSERPIDA